ncbi:hypothetical protein J6V86_03815 [bacterium]|nr:hypothetical protein [bacterium]
MRQVFVKWNGESIPLPTDGWKEAEGSSLTNREKQILMRGHIVPKDKSENQKFFAKDIDEKRTLMSRIVSKCDLDKLAEIAKKKREGTLGLHAK